MFNKENYKLPVCPHCKKKVKSIKKHLLKKHPNLDAERSYKVEKDIPPTRTPKEPIKEIILDYSDAITVSSIKEEYKIAGKHKCECRGRLMFSGQSLLAKDNLFYDELKYYCVECERKYSFLFDINSFFPD